MECPVEGAFYSSNILESGTLCSLRTEYDVSYCVHSTWFSRSFNNYAAALKFIEMLNIKYKRISYLSISSSKILIDSTTKTEIEKIK